MACFALTISAPLILIVIGSVFINACPAVPSLTISSIVIGTLTTLGNAVNLLDQYFVTRFDKFDHPLRKQIVGCVNLGLNCLFFMSVLFATVIVYFSGRPSSSKGSDDYCNPVLYNFVFWMINALVAYFVVIVILVLMGYLGAVLIIAK